MFTGESERPGTAFLVGRGSDQRLVTARHLCNDEHEEVAYLRHPGTNGGHAFRAVSAETLHRGQTSRCSAFRIPSRSAMTFR
jgi:hypothetical protein